LTEQVIPIVGDAEGLTFTGGSFGQQANMVVADSYNDGAFDGIEEIIDEVIEEEPGTNEQLLIEVKLSESRKTHRRFGLTDLFFQICTDI
jgi:hypothetical protein